MKRQTQLLSTPPTQSGFTLIEALLAIIIVSVLLVAIAPVIALSVATRVQARRVEQATQAARTYIDGVRSGQIEIPNARKRLVEVTKNPLTGTLKFTPKRENFADVAAPPPTLPNCNTTKPSYPYCQNIISSNGIGSLYCVDLDGKGCSSGSSKDFVIQAFRSVTSLTSDDGSNGYLLGVRVYRAKGFDGADTLKTTLNTGGSKVATYTGGSGNRYAPLVEMTTDVRGKSTNFSSFCDRVGGEGCP
jgi:prepilin-type N-terminal cleavage/methylation domain-containing protein